MTVPTTWETAAQSALDWLLFPRTYDTHTARGAVGALKDQRDQLMFLVRDHTLAMGFESLPEHPMHIYRRMARVAFPMAAKAAGRAHDRYAAELHELICSKHFDYGPGNILKGGWVLLVGRTNDKVERLDNLVSALKRPKTEALEDAYADVVGYAAIAYMVHGGTFTLPLGGTHSLVTPAKAMAG